MARFTVRIEMSIYPKGDEKSTLEEEYPTWESADRAYCAYRELTRLDSSRVSHVELIEHREEKVHKAATKGDDSNVIAFGSLANGTNG